MNSLDLLLRGATIVCGDRLGTVINDGFLAVSGGKIAAVGPQSEIPDHFAPVSREVLDVQGKILMPGLINTHCHLGDSLFRGLVEDLPLETWLPKVWEAEIASLNPETAKLGTKLGLAELALSGVTCVVDMFWFPEMSASVAVEAGMRFITGGIVIDMSGPDKKTPQDRLADVDSFVARWKEEPLITPAVMAHGAYTTQPVLLKKAFCVAEKYDVIFHIHCAETKVENETVQAIHGSRVVPHLGRLGILDQRTLLAHCVDVNDKEILQLADAGVSVSHCPVSNLKTGSGIAPVPEMLSAGVKMSLGTDGPISGNDMDLWLAIRLAAILHRGVQHKADIVTGAEALAMVTWQGAEAIGMGHEIGVLEKGKSADMVLLNCKSPHAIPKYDAITHLIFSTAKSDIENVWVAGKQIVSSGKMCTLDVDAIVAEVEKLAPNIKAANARKISS